MEFLHAKPFLVLASAEASAALGAFLFRRALGHAMSRHLAEPFRAMLAYSDTSKLFRVCNHRHVSGDPATANAAIGALSRGNSTESDPEYAKAALVVTLWGSPQYLPRPQKAGELPLPARSDSR